jgi:hypothetical protein
LNHRDVEPTIWLTLTASDPPDEAVRHGERDLPHTK